MKGREVFRHAVVKMAEAVDAAIGATGISAADLDWLVPHQANRRIIDGMGQRLRSAGGEGGRHRRPPCQYLGRFDPAGPRRRGPGRPYPARASGAAGSHGRRLHLGLRAGPLVDGRGRVRRARQARPHGGRTKSPIPM